MSSSLIEAVNENLRQLDRLRKEQDSIFARIKKAQAKLSSSSKSVESTEKSNEGLWSKLYAHYVEAKKLAEDEESTSSSLISQLDSLIAPGQSTPHRKKIESGEPKRKRIKGDGDASRMALPSSTMHRSPVDFGQFHVGDQVAARVSRDNSEKDEWIVVKVTRFDRETNKYDVVDEDPDEDEESAPRKYKLPLTCIIPLPKYTEPPTAPDFPINSPVLAVYPGTTALYRATVVGLHRKRKNEEYYTLEFDDDEEDGVDGLPKRQVPFSHVVQLPEGHRK